MCFEFRNFLNKSQFLHGTKRFRGFPETFFGEKVGDTLVPIMQFKALDAFCKRAGMKVTDFKPHIKNGELYFGEN